MRVIKRIHHWCLFYMRNPSLLAAWVFPFLGHRDFCHFMVLGHARTGSTLLMRLLASHPGVYVEEETFQKVGRKPIRLILGRIYSSKPRNIKAAGFKILYTQPLDRKDSKVWDLLTEDSKIHVIHLKRRNVLRIVASRKIALKTGEWTRKTGSANDRKKLVRIEKEELIKKIEEVSNWEREHAERFKDHPVLDVYYEDLANDRENTMQTVLKFLKLEDAPLATTLRKQNPEHLSKLIENYEELKEEFKGTPYAPWFE